jgi:tRNA splicing ligase
MATYSNYLMINYISEIRVTFPFKRTPKTAKWTHERIFVSGDREYSTKRESQIMPIKGTEQGEYVDKLTV